MSTFDTWLRDLAAARKGPVTLYITRAAPWSYSFSLPGDWHTATLTGSLRVSPDATGSTLTDFTVGTPSYSSGSGLTTFTLSLTKTQTTLAGLGDDDGDGEAECVFDVLIQHSSLPVQDRLFGGDAIISGKVTNAA